MIRSVELSDWRSHEKTRLEFSRGTNLLIGIMGSGKSSVVDAMCFALFGTFPALQHKKIKLSDIIRSGSGAGEAQVKLEFEVGEDTYEVLRIIKAEGGSEAELRKGGKLIEGPQPVRVTEHIEEMLQIDYELFSRAVYSEQNRIDYFLELGKGERKKQIDELLGLSRFESARSGLSSVLNTLKEMKGSRGALVSAANEEELKKELEALEKELSESRKQAEEMKKRLDSVSGGAKSLLSAYSSLQQLERRHNEISKKAFGLEGMLSQALKEAGSGQGTSEDADASRMRSLSENVKSAEKGLAALDERLRGIARDSGQAQSRKSEIERANNRRRQLEEELAALSGGRDQSEMKGMAAQMRQRADGCVAESAQAQARCMELKKALKELEQEISACPVCDSPLPQDKKESLLKAKKKELMECEGKEKDLAMEFKRVKSELEEAERGSRRSGELSSMLSELRAADPKEEDEKLMQFKKQAEDLALERKLAEQGLGKLREELLRAEHSVRSWALRSQLDMARTELQKLAFSQQDLEQARESLEKARIEEGSLKARLESAQSEERKAAQLIKVQGERLAGLVSQKREIGKIERAHNDMSIFRNAVVETQGALRGELIEAINAAMEGVWGALYPYGDFSKIRLNASEGDYELEAYKDGAWKGVEGIASGGERACACLALRIAFAMVLVPNLNWLILDEPTHNLDEEAVRSLSRALYEQIPNIVDQTFVITHDENLKDAASGSLYIFTRDKSKGEASRVEKQ